MMSKKRLRQNKIIDLLEKKKSLSVEEMALSFEITEATIRRDLEVLEREGKIIRTHGGARIVQEDPSIAKPFGDRWKDMLEEKEAIVNKVAKVIPDGSVITLDNGTTAWLLAKQLKDKEELTVITNSLLITQELYDEEKIKLLMTGGTFRRRNFDFVGEKTVNFLREIYSDIAILTCDSFRPGLGFYKRSESSAEIAKAATEFTNKVYILADHTKINAEGSHKFTDSEQVEIFFTDSNILEKDKKLLKKERCNIFFC